MSKWRVAKHNPNQKPSTIKKVEKAIIKLKEERKHAGSQGSQKKK